MNREMSKYPFRKQIPEYKDWQFKLLDEENVRASNKKLCNDYSAMDRYDLLNISSQWRQMAIDFTEATKQTNHYHGFIVHDNEINRITKILETALSDRKINGVSTLGRCLRRPDDGHLHWALAALDELDAKLRTEASNKNADDNAQTKNKEQVMLKMTKEEYKKYKETEFTIQSGLHIPKYPFLAGYVETHYAFLADDVLNSDWGKELDKAIDRFGEIDISWYYGCPLKKWMDNWFNFSWNLSDLKALLRRCGITRQEELNQLSFYDIQSIIRLKIMDKNKPSLQKDERRNATLSKDKGQGFMSITDIAKKHNITEGRAKGRLQKRLDRFRENNLYSDDWIENEYRGKNKSRYLYRYEAIKPLLKDFA